MRRVENHAALAWQQAPPEAEIIQDQIAASVQAASEVPSEASQLSQPSSGNKRLPAAQHRENPLEGHPRYRCVQDLSRQITHSGFSRDFASLEIFTFATSSYESLMVQVVISYTPSPETRSSYFHPFVALAASHVCVQRIGSGNDEIDCIVAKHSSLPVELESFKLLTLPSRLGGSLRVLCKCGDLTAVAGAVLQHSCMVAKLLAFST